MRSPGRRRGALRAQLGHCRMPTVCDGISAYRMASSDADSCPASGHEPYSNRLDHAQQRPRRVGGDYTANSPAATPCSMVSTSICSTRRRWAL
jgi:hypothetical protein